MHNSRAFTCFKLQTNFCKATALISCKIRGPSIPQPSAMISIKEEGKGKGREQGKWQGESNDKKLGVLMKTIAVQLVKECT